VAAGSIRHAIRFTTELTRNAHLWPARHDAGSANPEYPPMGARFRLKASFDISGFGAKARVVLRAMKRYGLILADNGANWFFQGAQDPRWKSSLLEQLKSVPASEFEAVDVSSCIVEAGSGEARCSQSGGRLRLRRVRLPEGPSVTFFIHLSGRPSHPDNEGGRLVPHRPSVPRTRPFRGESRAVVWWEKLTRSSGKGARWASSTR
jgi:hypothetical protein